MQKVMTLVATPEQREVLLHHARLVVAAGDQSVTEESDRADIHTAYEALVGDHQ